MKRITPEASWPASWHYSYPYDLMEIWGDMRLRGYAYAYDNRRQETLRLIEAVAKPGARVLDVAAAQGNFSLALAERGYEVTWNDLREDLAGYVRLKHERGSVHYAPGNVLDLAFEAPFDVVLIAEVIEHVAHPDAFLRRIGELVKPGGHVVMTTPNGGYVQNRLPRFSACEDPSRFEAVQFGPNGEDHIFLLHVDELAPLVEAAGLELCEIALFTNPLTNGFMKTEALLRVVPRGVVQAAEGLTRALPLPVRHKLHTAMAVLLRRPLQTAGSR